MSRKHEPRRVTVAGVAFNIPKGRPGEDLRKGLEDLVGLLEGDGGGGSWAEIAGLSGVMRRLDGLRLGGGLDDRARRGIDRLWKRYGNDLAERDYQVTAGAAELAAETAEAIRDWEGFAGEELGWAEALGMRAFMREVAELRAGGLGAARRRDRETIEWGWDKYCGARARAECADEAANEEAEGMSGFIPHVRAQLEREAAVREAAADMVAGRPVDRTRRERRRLDGWYRERLERLWGGGGLDRGNLEWVGMTIGLSAGEALGDAMPAKMKARQDGGEEEP